MPRVLLIYLLILPLAALMGFMLATPTDFSSFAFLVMGFSILLIPVMLRSYQFLLACTWNAAIIVFFLPGQPYVGTVLAFFSLVIAVITRTMSKEKRFLSVPSLSLSLIALAIVVIITAKLTGGIGARVLGAETWGAKRYLGVFGAVVGYFALTTQRIPLEKAALFVTVFFLGGMTSLISDLAFIAGPSFYFLFILFPSDYASSAAVTAETLMRLSGVAFACAWGYYFFLARYGIQELLDLHKPWRLLLTGLCIIGAMLGGYRGLLIMMGMVLVVLFFVEGVYKTRVGPVLIFASIFLLIGTVTFIDKMPLSVQRAFSFLPMDRIDSTARLDALATLDWRLSMWKILVPEVPKYLILGKGYSFNGTDYYLTQEAVRRGLYTPYEDTLISGNYHNGILTLLIPFGIFGFAAFMWFCGAGLWTLFRNHRYGNPELKPYNTFLLAYFVSQLLFYFIFYGQFDLDLIHFTGTVGLSVALNGGACSAASRTPEPVLTGELVPAT